MKAKRIHCTLIATLIAAAGCSEDAPGDAAESREAAPLILISVDALRADRLGCYGYRRRPTSPAIDALAADGVLFERTIAAAPWTTPSHMTMLTSLSPSGHGVTASFRELKRGLTGGGEFVRLPGARTTLAEALSSRGYATAAFTAGGCVAPILGFGQGFDSYDVSMHKLTEKNTGRMWSWIESVATRPFFLFWHNFEVHAPYLDARFLDEALPGADARAVASRLRELAGLPLPYVAMGERPQRQRQGQLRALKSRGAFGPAACEALYSGGVRSFDEWLGRLVSRLKKKGIYQRALIVLTSDHGEEFAEHDPEEYYDAHGHSLYGELLRVPLIVKLPGGAHAGERVEAVARTVDVMPTVLDVLDLTPAGSGEMQGSSLRPLWEGRRRASRVAFGESLITTGEKKSAGLGRWKYIVGADAGLVAKKGRAFVPPPGEGDELYDLREDPGEQRNLLDGNGTRVERRIAERLNELIREHVESSRGKAEPVELGGELVDKLRGLGYVE
ncbi:MAG: sulfatase [Polyangia bacterium]